jgi:prepilin-type N-terminal cleavage/methylation domain-containing protein
MRLRINIKKHSGFTAMELLVATALLAVMTGLLFTMVASITDITTYNYGRSTVFQDSRVIIDQMGRELQQAVPYVTTDGLTTNDIFLGVSSLFGAELHFVAVIDNNRGREEAEVHYLWDGSNTLYKSIVFSGDTNVAGVPIWDFADNTPIKPDWFRTPTNSYDTIDPKYVPVLEGVLSMELNFWTNSPPREADVLTSWLVNPRNQIPNYVRVRIETLDPHLVRRYGGAINVPLSLTNSARTFSFLTFLPRSTGE